MRLFVAIQLSDPARQAAEKITGLIRRRALAGSFVPVQNLHLTLVFIGETDRPALAKEALAALRAQPLQLVLAGSGRFARREGDVVWAGIQAPPELFQLRRQLVDLLGAAGFSVDAKAFRPHITLGRRVLLARNTEAAHLADSVAPVPFWVDRLHLMHSHRVAGQLRYTSAFSVPLEALSSNKLSQ